MVHCVESSPSVKRVICDKTKENCAHILIPHERTFILVLKTKRMVGRSDTFYLKFWV